MGLTTEKASDGGRIHVRLDELNRAYAELVRKYKDITRERNELMGMVDEVTRANKIMEQDF
jgi:hypothetical protein